MKARPRRIVQAALVLAGAAAFPLYPRAASATPLGSAQQHPRAHARGAHRALSADAPVSAGKNAPPSAARLTASNGGQLVYDRVLNVTWLADANLPASMNFGVSGINASGSMDFATASKWLAAMNALNHGAGYLGHHDWALPTTPPRDSTCSSHHKNSFGFGCRGSTLGSLYYGALGLTNPNSAVAPAHGTTGPFRNMQPYLYWSASGSGSHPKNVNGFMSFSFNTGFQGSNVSPNYLYVLPMIKGQIRGAPPPSGTGLQVNPGGQTVFDPIANVTWLADADLAASRTFGVSGINRDGSMTHDAATRFVKALRDSAYLGQNGWDLPGVSLPDASCSMKQTFGFHCAGSPLGVLFYRQLKLKAGQSVAPGTGGSAGPFRHVQPYLYWACQGRTSQSPCDPNGPASGFEWSFSFGNGFEGTDVMANQLYVMVNYPGPPTQSQPPSPPCRGLACR